MLFYVLAPIPTMISKQQNFDSGSRGLEFAIFVTFGLIFSSFALSVVLCLAGKNDFIFSLFEDIFKQIITLFCLIFRDD